MSAVELRQVSFDYRDRPVLRQVDFRAQCDQYVVLLGSSGSGKSTLLNVIAGLLSPKSGSVWMGGQCVDKLSPRRRSVSMVFQQSGLYPHMRVHKVLRFGKQARQSSDQHIADVIELTGIGDLLDRYPDQLSGGQLRRVAMAKAMIRGDRVRLLDEPLSALDMASSQAFERDLLQWHRVSGGTTIHVTHDGAEAMRLADRIAVLHEGEILQCDSPHAVYESPRSIDVANSLGAKSMNSITYAPDSLTLGLGTLPGIGNHPNRRVIVGVRPEHLHVDQAPSQTQASHRDGLTIQLASARIAREGGPTLVPGTRWQTHLASRGS